MTNKKPIRTRVLNWLVNGSARRSIFKIVLTMIEVSLISAIIIAIMTILWLVVRDLS